MADRDPDAEAVKLTANMDQAEAALRGVGRGLAAMHTELATAVGKTVATRIVRDVAHEWAAGTFTKAPDLSNLLGGKQ